MAFARRTLPCFLPLLAAGLVHAQDSNLRLDDRGFFETRGLNVLVFNNWYDGSFSDAKMAGVEIIHHGVRTATNGDVRLSPTPAQWDPIPTLVARNIVKEDRSVEVSLRYPAYDFAYRLRVTAEGDGVVLSVHLEKPLPQALEGRAGLNLEFLPSVYREKAYLMDGRPGIFPLSPGGPMTKNAAGEVEPLPLATGHALVLAPADSAIRVAIRSRANDLQLYDGRNVAQNGWFVVRSLIPASRTGEVVTWTIKAWTIPGWVRTPVIAHSQAGYDPRQRKVAVIELDPNDRPLPAARLVRIDANGKESEAYRGDVKPWGPYMRYEYCTLDFSGIKEEGLYAIEYGNVRTRPFPIMRNVYAHTWEPTLDVYLPVQMDHMEVREAYRVWHGAAHLDDALQAPVNHEHFDLYAQGPTTDSPYKPGEHIPGLNVGGWFDAGDYDIRTQTQEAVVLSLVHTWEAFHPRRDETTVDRQGRLVVIHQPDGKPDILQQIEQGALGLLAQQEAVGHAINGIIESRLSQYTHLGDASTVTDNLVYNPKLREGQTDGFTSGTFDDRWAFTSKSSALNYGSAAALAAASRALRGYNDTLAARCLETARKVWDEEETHKPDMFRHGNTTGGALPDEKLKAAVELLLSTGERRFRDTVETSLPVIRGRFPMNAPSALLALPMMDAGFKSAIEEMARTYKTRMDSFAIGNPFGVLITRGGWGGSGAVVGIAATNYLLHRAFPEIVGAEDVFQGLDYLYGCHPASDISFVSGVGSRSKRIAYGNNRADFAFIPGGVVPGILVLKPDFPENKEDWPFLWGENESVVSLGASYIYLVQAANALLDELPANMPPEKTPHN